VQKKVFQIHNAFHKPISGDLKDYSKEEKVIASKIDIESKRGSDKNNHTSVVSAVESKNENMNKPNFGKLKRKLSKSQSNTNQIGNPVDNTSKKKQKIIID